MKIEVKQLTKRYGDHLALNQLNFEIHSPKIYGLLGRNGAGKTTLMNILAGCLPPTEGNIYIDGQIPFDNQAITEAVCLINESENFKKGLTVGQVLKISSFFYPSWNHDLAEQLLKEFRLKRSMKVKALSKGMGSALGIIVGLASQAPITIFDEPYIGLDAPSRARFYDLLLQEYEANPRTFILSTHLIDEVSQLFEEVLIIHEGKLLLHEETDNLRASSFAITGSTQDVEAYIENKKVLHTKTFAGRMTAYLFGTEDDQAEAELCRLEVSGLPIQELMIHLTAYHQGGVSH